MSKIKVEVEGKELALKNSHGDIVIIPKDKRVQVEQMIKDKCWSCVDRIVSVLPTMEDYAEDGTIVPGGDNKRRYKMSTEDNTGTKNVDTSDPEYIDDVYAPIGFKTGIGSEENPIDLPEHVVHADPMVKYRREYMDANPTNINKDIEKRINNPVGREIFKLNNVKGWKEELKHELIEDYIRKMKKDSAERFLKDNPMKEGQTRVEYLNSLTASQEDTMKELDKFKMSAVDKVALNFNLMTIPEAAKKHATEREYQARLKLANEDPLSYIATQLLDHLGLLAIPGSVVQSIYNPDYTFRDGIVGQPNDASGLEVLITDIIGFAGMGLLKKAVVDTAIQGLSALRNASNMKQVLRLEEAIRGAGVEAKSLGKGFKSESVLGDINVTNESVYNPFEKSKIFTGFKNNRLDNISSELQTLPLKVNKNYQKYAKDQLAEGNKWVKDWYNDPIIKEKVLALKKEEVERINQKITESNKWAQSQKTNPTVMKVMTKEQIDYNFKDRPYVDINDYTSTWDTFLSNIKADKFEAQFETKSSKLNRLILGERKLFEEGVSGKSISTFTKDDVFKSTQTLVNKYSKDIASTTVHEDLHTLLRGNVLIPQFIQKQLVKIFGPDTAIPIKNIKGRFNSYIEYLQDPREIYARMGEIRKFFGWKPKQVITDEDMLEVFTEGVKGNLPVDKYFIASIEDWDLFKLLFNKLPYILLAAGISEYNNENDKTE